MGGKRKTDGGVAYTGSVWGGEGPARTVNRREEISVGLIETLTSLWKSAGLKATFEISDTIQRGLRLRVQPRGPTFFARVQYQGKESRVRIGRIDAWGLAHARHACAAIVRHVSTGNGIPSDNWIELQRQSLLHADARKKGRTNLAALYVPEVMPRQTPAATWTYAEARDAYLAWLQSECDEGVYAQPTVENYRKTLRCPALRAFDAMPVVHIAPASIAQAVEELRKAGKRTQAADVVRKARMLWRWMRSPDRERASGITTTDMDRLKGPKLVGVKERQHFPPVEECGLILATARCGVLNPAIGAAIQLAAWTGQRRLSVVMAYRDDFEAWDGSPGWGLWRCWHRKPSGKKGKEHVIPLPPAAWAPFSAYLAWHRLKYCEDQRWAFPQQRPAKADAPGEMARIAEDTLTHTVRAIPGSESSPHDLRRGLSSTVQEKGNVHVALVGYILDHGDEAETVRQSNGTTRRYTEAELLGFKRPVMEAWERFLEPAAVAAVLLPREELKAELVKRRAEQRGVDLEKEYARLRLVSAKAYTKKRRRAEAVV
ncbi:integrase family protein [Methylobacterium sp. J-088]|uniref:integrase family protein n=1 Tax=Methylobacterium sp. J-088 TaxID=2836664 RepID=UPI001FBA5D5C|nr:integrase family protein [Methylobacterium sp. J-088]MCJ2061596.1 integrase family protein [Methylobacterium sp. J-088]